MQFQSYRFIHYYFFNWECETDFILVFRPQLSITYFSKYISKWKASCYLIYIYW